MLNRFRQLLFAISLFVPTTSGLLAQEAIVNTNQDYHVRVDLIPEQLAAVPGTTMQLALRMDHKEGWHTYWTNPGDAGRPTEITWQLPSGVSAGDIQWPVPERFDLPADLVDFGYTGEIFLLVPLTLAADYNADTLPLQAEVHWYECEAICIPANAEISLELPVKREPPVAVNETWQYGFEQTLGQQPEDVDLHSMFTVAEGNINILLQATEPLFENVKSVAFIPSEHQVFDYLDKPEISYQTSSLQLSQAYHRRLEEAVPARISGLLLADNRDGSRHVYEFSAEPEGVDVSALGGLLPVVQNSHGGTPLWLAFGFALLGGLILNLMPCVFPVLSLKVISLVEGSHSAPREQRWHALVYTLGVVLAFLLLASVLLALQAAGRAVGWGFHLQSPWFVAVLSYLFFLMGLSLSGVVEFGTRLMGVGSDLTLQSGYRGSFFTGLLAGVVASPCTAPFMGPALGFALTQSAPVALSVFIALGLGMSLPFLLISFVPALAHLLPKPGHWMVTFKKLMAIPLYLTVLWLLWVLSRQVAEPGLLLVVAAIVLIGLAAWYYQPQRGSGKRRPAAGPAFGAVIVLALAVLATPLLQTNAGQLELEEGVEPYTTARLAELRDAGQPVFVNMTASWCITCLVNERVALSLETVKAAMEEQGITYLKGDWTNNDPEITAVLKQFNTSGVPLYLLYPADPGAPAKVLPQILTEAVLLGAFEEGVGY